MTHTPPGEPATRACASLGPFWGAAAPPTGGRSTHAGLRLEASRADLAALYPTKPLKRTVVNCGLAADASLVLPGCDFAVDMRGLAATQSDGDLMTKSLAWKPSGASCRWPSSPCPSSFM